MDYRVEEFSTAKVNRAGMNLDVSHFARGKGMAEEKVIAVFLTGVVHFGGNFLARKGVDLADLHPLKLLYRVAVILRGRWVGVDNLAECPGL